MSDKLDFDSILEDQEILKKPKKAGRKKTVKEKKNFINVGFSKAQWDALEDACGMVPKATFIRGILIERGIMPKE